MSALAEWFNITTASVNSTSTHSTPHECPFGPITVAISQWCVPTSDSSFYAAMAYSGHGALTKRESFSAQFVSLGNLYESLLNELNCSGHGIGVDFDFRKQILITPIVNFRGRTTQLHADITLH
jgi:hypothetical protein